MSAAAGHRLSRSRMDKSASFINRVFNLRSGELVRGLPLFGYYFLVITFYMMARVARDAIFLDKFNREQLPYADMSAALAAAFILAPYIRAGYKVSLRNLQLGSLILFATNVVAFSWGSTFLKWPLLPA